MGNIHSFRFTGIEKLDIQSIFNKLSNNFTYEFWVKPEDMHRPVNQTNSGISGIFDQRYVIVPGNLNYTNHAGAGVSVGTNGVSVFEHSTQHLPAVLVDETPILDWTHIAIVYEDKTPKLYLNGIFIKEGLKSNKQNVFASGQFGAHDKYGQFKGLIRDLRIWNHARTQEQIKENMDNNLMGSEEGLYGYWKLEKKDRYIPDYSTIGNHGILVINGNNHFLKILNESELEIDIPNYPTIDIVIPIFNAFEYVQKCIETVYRNTLIPYNLYLINDCSTDERVFNYLEQLRKDSKPPHLLQLNIIHNKQNLGYVKSVNKALTISENHVVLLNSDTEVPPNWMKRLITPILLTNNIASVTPFSNSATICSFPNIGHNNPLPAGMTVDQVDQFFEKYGSSQPIELPTGHGFCMAINRKAIQTIGYFDDLTFNKGYGEENDWCMRAYRSGYKNVLIPNLFIYHKHGMSFNEEPKKRQELRVNNLNKLYQLYPEYSKRVSDFFANDPLKPIRAVINSAILAKKQKGILFINHSWGGGTEYYQSLTIKNRKNTSNCYRLRLENQTKKLIIDDLTQGTSFKMSITDLSQRTFNNLLKLFNIELIYIDQLVSYPVFKLIELIQNTGVEYVFDIHDFYCVCPSFMLINNRGKYCNAETDISICQKCISSQTRGIDIQNWRKTFQSFLENASEIMAPSENTKELILNYYPNLEIKVGRNRQKVETVKHTFSPEFAMNTEMNIAFIGAIFKAKGSGILFNLLEQIRQEKLPINIKVIGTADGHTKKFLSEDKKLEVTGRYNNAEISNLLAKHHISLVVIPALWPETYSWTTSEAMWSGYPVITFNLGAPADRVRQLNGGWIAEDMNSNSILQLLKELLNSREEILEKAENLKKAYWDS